MKRTFLILLSVLVLILLAVTGCGGGRCDADSDRDRSHLPTLGAEPTSEVVEPPAAAGVEILEAIFAHGLGEEMQPIDPGSEFSPGETVNLSLKIKGRPKEGVVTARFFWYDSPITEASVDLADANSGLLFSFGEDTYVGYSLTPDQPFPLSDQYSALVLFNDEPVDVYSFSIVPPPDAIPSTVSSVTLARGATANYDPIAPTTEFSSTDGGLFGWRGRPGHSHLVAGRPVYQWRAVRGRHPQPHAGRESPRRGLCVLLLARRWMAGGGAFRGSDHERPGSGPLHLYHPFRRGRAC